MRILLLHWRPKYSIWLLLIVAKLAQPSYELVTDSKLVNIGLFEASGIQTRLLLEKSLLHLLGVVELVEPMALPRDIHDLSLRCANLATIAQPRWSISKAASTLTSDINASGDDLTDTVKLATGAASRTRRLATR